MDSADQEYQKVGQQSDAVITVEAVEASSLGVEPTDAPGNQNQANTGTTGAENLALSSDFIRYSLFITCGW